VSHPALPLLALLATAGVRADSLDSILAHMDDSAKKFKSVSANVHRVEFTAVINESSEEDGQMRLKHAKSGLLGVLVFTGTDARTIGFRGRIIEMYLPKAKTVQRADASKYANSLDAYLLLAFGTATSKDLKAAYDITAPGAEAVDGKHTTRLELIPKSSEVRKLATKIELWIPDGDTIAIKEKITEPSKNTVLFTYSTVKINPSIPDSDFELKIPAGTKSIQIK
jgi:outer membrane lipoprotein-sorting protein